MFTTSPSIHRLLIRQSCGSKTISCPGPSATDTPPGCWKMSAWRASLLFDLLFHKEVPFPPPLLKVAPVPFCLILRNLGLWELLLLWNHVWVQPDQTRGVSSPLVVITFFWSAPESLQPSTRGCTALSVHSSCKFRKLHIHSDSLFLSFLFTLCVCAKSLQPCPTLCDPMDCSPWGCLCQRDSPGKDTGVCHHVLLPGIFPTVPLCVLHWHAGSFFTHGSPGKPFFWLWDPLNNPLLWPPYVKNWLTWKDPDAGKDWRQEEKGTTEDEMVGWHYWLNGHEFG